MNKSLRQTKDGKRAEPREDRLALGIILMAIAVLFFTLIDTSAKWLILGGLPALQVVFARYAGHFLGAILFYVPRNGVGAFRSEKPLLQFLRSAFLLFSTVFNFAALHYLPITITTTIFFTGPIVVTIMSIPILGEKVGIRRLTAVIVGFFGILVVMQPWGAQWHPAMFLSIGAMTCASSYFILTRLLAGKESNATSQLWSSGLATICFIPIIGSIWVWPDTVMGYVVLICIGGFGLLGHSLATFAHRLADASILAPVVYLQMLFATAAGVLVFATPPTIYTLIGGSIVIAAGIYIWWRERQLKLHGN